MLEFIWSCCCPCEVGDDSVNYNRNGYSQINGKSVVAIKPDESSIHSPAKGSPLKMMPSPVQKSSPKKVPPVVKSESTRLNSTPSNYYSFSDHHANLSSSDCEEEDNMLESEK